MQTLVIEATTHDHGQELYSVLSEFHPELFDDANCDRNVSIGLVSDRQVVEVLDAIQRYLTENALRSLVSSLRIAVGGRSFTLYA
jgi:hypothetical protein